MDADLEKIVSDRILPDLKKGRVDFDFKHTKAVVFWMKYLLSLFPSQASLKKILITAAYAHDWGYVGLFEGIDSNNLVEIAKQKPLHMQKGAEKIKQFLSQDCSLFFSQEEVEMVSHLVAVHDVVEDLHTEEELFLMEADTLGMLDVKRSPPTFSKKDNEHFIKTQIYGRRIPHFMHDEAKKQALSLAKKRLAYYP